jgi:hypothetical protein
MEPRRGGRAEEQDTSSLARARNRLGQCLAALGRQAEGESLLAGTPP